MNAYLHGFGAHLPSCVVTNAELSTRLADPRCTPEWIESVSGIRERRWADKSTSVADLAVAAAENCLARTATDRGTLGLLIAASSSSRLGFPGPAAEIGHRLGLGSTPVLDLPIASAGSIFAIALAARLADSTGDILVVAAEKMSAIVQSHPLDAGTSILFGDGAGAALISPRPGPLRVISSAIHSDGQNREDLAFHWSSPLRMNGPVVIRHASSKIPAVVREALERASIAPADVTAFLMHQANQNLLAKIAKSLAVPAERIFSNIARYGNTSSASMLIAASEWMDSDPAAGPVVFAGFGAGFNWGALVAR